MLIDRHKIVIFLILFCSIYCNAQELSQTIWKTDFNNSEVIVEFAQDSLSLIIGNEKLEISTYSTANDTLILVDHPGSACTDTVVGLYLFSIVNNNMFIELISDSCTNRRQFFEGRTLVKCVTSNVGEPEYFKPVVFPNPNYSNVFFVKNSGGKRFEYIIYNKIGKVVQSGQTYEVIEINSDEVFLFLRLQNEKQKFTYKLIRF